MIIDDEEIIVRGLTRVLPWEKYSCTIAATAGSVTAAADAIHRHIPDILFTDIRMPDGDGLTLLASLKTQYPDMQVSVLTGYRDFDYAQQAIKLGVTRYLLKPSRMDELEEALEAMVFRIKQLGDRPAAGEPRADAAGSFIVRQAVTYIEANCIQRLSLQDVAAICYVSQWHLSKLLGKYTGQSFYDLLNSARVKRAKELMRDPSLRIGDIAELVGYNDTSHFSRVFKKTIGVSANEYRNNHVH